LSAGLDEITVSLDTLQPDKYTRITKRDVFGKVWQGLESALDAGFSPIKLNVVLMAGVNDDEIMDFVQLARERPIIVRFIEYMPFKDNGWSEAKLISYHDVLEEIKDRFRLEAITPTSGSQVAKEFLVDGRGKIGFVTSMTEDFCSTCSRMRLTSDGAIKSCLHDGAEFSVRELLRNNASDAMVEAVLEQSLRGKLERHASISELYQIENRTMIAIGG
jgi:molybdenum cofactor biosynthesis enzyme MoaA